MLLVILGSNLIFKISPRPVTQYPNGSVATVAGDIASKLGSGVTTDQVLLAWVKKKLGAGVVVT